LLQRIEYLARAVMCMRSDQVGYAPHLGVFLRDLEDKIDVARIQQQVGNCAWCSVYFETETRLMKFISNQKFVVWWQNFPWLQVLEAVTKLKGRHRLAEDAILRLNSSLLEITQVCQNCQIQCSYQVSGLQTQVKLPSPSDVSTSYQKNGHHEW